jgi:hypothetical protein
MIAVVCVYWEGVFRGRERIYSPEWVYKLESMVKRNLTLLHSFTCFTNVPEKFDNMQTVRLINNWPGWWSKLEIFKPGIFPIGTEKILYLDLDLVILQNLESLINFNSKFTLLGIGKGQVNHEKDGKMTIRRYNSSVMCFNPNIYSLLYTKFSENIMEICRGDQDWIGSCFEDLDTFPKKWIVKLRDLGKSVPEKDTKIVMCMEGARSPLKNKSAAKRYKWVNDIWK